MPRTTNKFARKKHQRNYLWEQSKGRCFYCKLFMKKMTSESDNLSCTIEHLQPKSMGGDNSMDNLAMAHLICNRLRSSTPLEDLPPYFIAMCREAVVSSRMGTHTRDRVLRKKYKAKY